MSFTNQEPKTKKGRVNDLQHLERIITDAIVKVGGNKENDLCKYIPISSGGYIHHFTLRKMKTEQPSELAGMIEKFIINVERPDTVAPKPRAPRGSRKRRDQITFTKGELERMLSLARQVGDNEIISKLTPKKSLASCKREIIISIKAGKVVPELWSSYVEAVNAVNNNETLMSTAARAFTPNTARSFEPSFTFVANNNS